MKGFCKALLLLIVNIALSDYCSSSIFIDEIMYDPEGSDSSHEWIEIYTNETTNISGWKIYESTTNHGLTLINGSWLLNSNSYAIIADDWQIFLSDYPQYNGTLIDTSWDSLSNSGEYLALKNNLLTVIDNLTYNTSIGASGNGKSLSLINGTWYESIATPGYENQIYYQNQSLNSNITNITNNNQSLHDLKLETYIEDTINLYQEQTKLFKITNLNPELGKVYNITVQYNITKNNTLVVDSIFVKSELNQYSTTDTGNYFPEDTGIFYICGRIINSSINDTNPTNDYACKNFSVIDTTNVQCNISLNISLVDNKAHNIYQNNEQMKYYINLNNETFYYRIQYWIEDLLSNIIKEPYNTTNTNQRTYTPTIEETDKVLLLKARLMVVACNDSNKLDNYYEELIIVNGTKTNFAGNSSIIIQDLELGSDNLAHFGDAIKVKLGIYKGDDTKKQIKVYVKDTAGNKISQTDSTFNVENKYTSYSLSVPVQLKANCNLAYGNGNYILYAEGLDSIAATSFKVEGIISSLCDCEIVEEDCSSTESTKKAKLTYNIIDMPEEINTGENIEVVTRIVNEDYISHNFEVYSYIYRGSKCYSNDGVRDGNKVATKIASGDYDDVKLKITPLKGIEPGKYKLKVKIRKDTDKTEKELNSEIDVMDSKTRSENNLQIKSFYTRAKKYSSQISLLANIKNEGFKDNVTLTLLSQKQTIAMQKNIQDTEDVKFNVKIDKGKNIFFLVLSNPENKNTHDVKELMIIADDNNLKTFNKLEEITTLSYGIESENINLNSAIDEVTKQTALASKKSIVYESTSKQARNNALEILLIAVGALCIYLCMIKKH
jgi:hypothetical protein